MPNGKPGDHPLTDMLVHGRHPFPKEIEELLRQVLELDPSFPDGRRRWNDQLVWMQMFSDWEAGKNIEQGKSVSYADLARSA